MSRWRRQQRKRAGQRRWLDKRVAEFHDLFAEGMQSALRDLFIPAPEAQARSPRDALSKLRASLDRFIQDPPKLGPSELVKLEGLYR